MNFFPIKSISNTLLLLILLIGQLSAQSQFSDVSASTGIAYSYSPQGFGAGVSLCDFDGDGWDDLSFGSIAGDTLYFYKNNNGVFTSVAFPAMATETGTSRSLYWVDYDNDADKDLYVCNEPGENKLYRNDGDLNFTDVTQTAGMGGDTIFSYAACWGDYNRDGWLDCYALNRNEDNVLDSPNSLYYNNGDGTFTEVSATAGVEDVQGLGFGAVFMDYNNDGWPDLYIANDKFPTSNVLYKNLGDGTFEDVSEPETTGLFIEGMGVGITDFDFNGYQDIYVTNTFGGPQAGNIFLNNHGDGTFTQDGEALGINVNKLSWGAIFADIDMDGDEDLYVANSNTIAFYGNNNLYYNEGDGTFTENLTDDAVIGIDFSFGAAMGDWNNDGYPDIVVMNAAGDLMNFWENKAGTGAYIKIDLQGVISNRDAIGVLVELWANGQRQIRYTKCGESYASQFSNTLMFGLGDQPEADSIILRWPSGVVNTYENIPVNDRYLFVEDTVGFNIDCTVTYYPDLDGDGFGNPFLPGTTSCLPLPGLVTNNTDCNDFNSEINPDALEQCDDTDHNCNGELHDGLMLFVHYMDSDGDGYGDVDNELETCLPGSVPGYVNNNLDCDDQDENINPAAAEICDGIDNNCSGLADDGLAVFTYYLDQDNDGYGAAQNTIDTCQATAPAGYVSNALDCDDQDENINPAVAEICDGIDNDCNGLADDGLAIFTYYLDQDNDGYGAAQNEIDTCQATAPAGYVSNALDCDDQDENINPAVAEICDGIDNDCNGLADDGLAIFTYYLDQDEDGYGDAQNALDTCQATPVNGYVTNNQDCNDNDVNINPTAEEVCDELDNDCNGLVDDGLPMYTYYADLDMDGYGTPLDSVVTCADLPVEGYTDNNQDCDDENAMINPLADEILNNGIDEDCDGEDLIVGLANYANKLAINVFPNPVAQKLTVEVERHYTLKMRLLSTDGQLIYDVDLPAGQNNISLDFEPLPAGIYLLIAFEATSGVFYYERIVRQ